MSTPPPEPKLDPDDGPPPKLMGVAFWLMIAFGLLCIAAGWAVARLGPTLLPPTGGTAAHAPSANGPTGK